MALTKTLPTQDAAGLPITDTRRVMAGLVAKNADGTPRPGIFPAHTNALVTGRASMGYDVAVFFAATSRINNGVEFVANDAVTVVPTTAAPGSNSRIDVIWVRARFVQHADGSNLPEFGVTQGVAAAVPTKPAIPAGALELATAVITSTTTTTATAVITQTHPYTAAAGGLVLVRNNTELQAWTPGEGALARRLDNGVVYEREGALWLATAGTATYSYAVNGLPDTATPYTAGALTALPGDTTDSGFITAINGSALTLRKGLYAFTFLVLGANAATGRTFVAASLGGTPISRSNGTVGEDHYSTSGQVYVPADGTVLTFGFFKTTGGTHNFTGYLRVARIA